MGVYPQILLKLATSKIKDLMKVLWQHFEMSMKYYPGEKNQKY